MLKFPAMSYPWSLTVDRGASCFLCPDAYLRILPWKGAMGSDKGELTWRTWIYRVPQGCSSALVTQGVLTASPLCRVCIIFGVLPACPRDAIAFDYLANDLVQSRLEVACMSAQLQEIMGGTDRYLLDSLKPQTFLSGMVCHTGRIVHVRPTSGCQNLNPTGLPWEVGAKRALC